MVFDPKYAGPAQPMIAGPKPNQTAEGFSENQVQVLAQQGNQSGNVAVTQAQPKNQGMTESQMKTLFDRYEDPDAEEKAREQGQLQGA